MKKSILFCYPQTISFSGQTKASEIILESFQNKNNYIFYKCLFPAFNRGEKNLLIYFSYIINIFKYYKEIIKTIFTKIDIIYLNIGQSISKIILQAYPLVLIKFFKKNTHFIISLHGNEFMNWNPKSLKSLLFIHILKKANIITTLGNSQELFLAKREILNYKRVLNTVDINPTNVSSVNLKQKKDKIIILHLSLLIESKGFISFLESIELVSNDVNKNNIEVILCGPPHTTAHCKRLKSNSEKEYWINKKIETLNEKNIKSKWIKGVEGVQKQKLLEESTIFVFPSNFPVESLPLVVIEAAATGNAIITTKVGEIQNVFDDKDVVFLNSTDATEISIAIKNLIKNKYLRTNLAVNARKKYDQKFSLKYYSKSWENIFNQI